MKANTETIKSTPLKNARKIAAMLENLPRDERLRIEGAISWALSQAGGRQSSA